SIRESTSSPVSEPQPPRLSDETRWYTEHTALLISTLKWALLGALAGFCVGLGTKAFLWALGPASTCRSRSRSATSRARGCAFGKAVCPAACCAGRAPAARPIPARRSSEAPAPRLLRRTVRSAGTLLGCSPPDVAQHKVVVVEDDVPLRESITDLLELASC